MFQSIIRAPLLFFDQNPVGINLISFSIKFTKYFNLIVHFDFLGRVLNRFTKDIGCMDEMLPSAFFDVITVSYLFIYFSNLLPSQPLVIATHSVSFRHIRQFKAILFKNSP
jgi:hypothetical protein